MKQETKRKIESEQIKITAINIIGAMAGESLILNICTAITPNVFHIRFFLDLANGSQLCLCTVQN